jgi:polyhydroxyalkanoate synthase
MAKESSGSHDEVAERAAGALAPETDLFGDLDAAGLGDALVQMARASAARPLNSASAAVQLTAELAQVPLAAAAQWLGRPIEPPVPLDPKDRRFADPAWSTNPFFYGTRLGYAAACRFARGMVGSAA